MNEQLVKSIDDVVSSLDELQTTLDEIQESLSSIFNDSGFGDVLENIIGIADGVVSIIVGFDNIKKIIDKKDFDLLIEIFGNLNNALLPIAGTLALLGSGYAYLIETNEVFAESTSETMEEVGGIFERVWTENIQPIIDSISTAIKNIWEIYLSDLLTNFGEAFAEIIELLGTVGGYMFDFVSTVVAPVFEWFGYILEGFVGAVSGMVSGLAEVLDGVITLINGVIKLEWEEAWEGIKEIASGALNFIISIMEGIVNIAAQALTGVANIVVGAANGLISVINSLGSVLRKFGMAYDNVKKLSPLNIPPVNIPRLALGGMVMPGQLFIAREAGPELVGSFGTRTAVMNNNQIVESVSRGVAMANMGEVALLREQNDLLRILINKKGSIAIGEREFGEVVVNALNRRTYELGDSGLRF